MGDRPAKPHTVFKNSSLNTKSLTLDRGSISDIRDRIDRRWIKVVGKRKKQNKTGNRCRNPVGRRSRRLEFLAKAGFRWFLIKSWEISGLCLSRA